MINRSHADKTAKLNGSRRGLRDPRIMSEDLSFSFFEGEKFYSIGGHDRSQGDATTPFIILRFRNAVLRLSGLREITSSAKD